MATDVIERVRYYQRQFLGAEDFQDEQAYHRDMRRRHNIAHHTWGIVVGLELIEKDKEGDPGAKDVYVQPGMAIDGFGREIVVLQPVKLDPADFDSFTNLLHREVWIAFDAESALRPASGYELCDVEDQSRRWLETYQIVIEPIKPTHDDVIVDGKVVHPPPPTNPGDLTIPVDESVPHQELPDDQDEPRWLVRLGSANWDGVNRKFVAAAPDRLLEGRRYVGAIAEDLYAPAGRLLVRSRSEANLRVGIGTTNLNGRLTIDGLEQPQQGTLTIFSETAEIEYDGGSDGVFVFKDKGGTTAFTGGKIGIGTTTPKNPLAIRATGTWEELISFESPAGATKWHINQKVNGATDGLNFAETGVADGRLFIKAGGNVGIGTLNPSGRLTINGIKQPQQGMLTIFSETADIEYDGGNDSRFIIKDTGGQTAFIGGNIGIGTIDPSARLHVVDQGQNAHASVISSDPSLDQWRNQLVLVGSGTNSEARLGFGTTRPDGTSHHTAIIKTIVPAGGGGDLIFQIRQPGFGNILERMRITNQGNVGIGTTNPQTELHVQGEIRGTVVRGAAWSHTEEITFTGSVTTNSTSWDEITEYRRTIVTPSLLSSLIITLHIPFVGNNTASSRSRIRLVFDGDTISDATKHDQGAWELHECTLTGLVQNVPAGSHIIRVYAAVDTGTLHIPHYNTSLNEAQLSPAIRANLYLLGLY